MLRAFTVQTGANRLTLARLDGVKAVCSLHTSSASAAAMPSTGTDLQKQMLMGLFLALVDILHGGRLALADILLWQTRCIGGHVALVDLLHW